MILANIVQMFQSSWLAGATMLALAIVFAIVLLIASIKLKVEVDPKVEQVLEALPGVDCGACGMPGCGKYAQEVVADPELLGKCAPGGPETAEKIAEILNLQMSGSGKPQRPVIHCRAHTEDRTYYAKYEGIPSCTAANTVPDTQACKFGCMGYGDCVGACKFDALHVIDGLAMVDYEACTGCGACAKACPRHLIEMVPFGEDYVMTVACSSKENGKSTRAMCKVGCIGCKMCVKQSDLFSFDNNLARMDYEKYEPSEATETAEGKCPTNVIIYRGKNAPQPRSAGVKKQAPAKA